MELEYGFLPQDFNDQNKGLVEKMLDTYQKQFEAELCWPDHPQKETRFKTIRHNIDKLQWYLDHYSIRSFSPSAFSIRISFEFKRQIVSPDEASFPRHRRATQQPDGYLRGLQTP